MAASPMEQAEHKTPRGIARWASQMISALVIYGAILFLTAGRINWIGGWAYLVMNAVIQLLSTVLLTSRQPAMLWLSPISHDRPANADDHGRCTGHLLRGD